MLQGHPAVPAASCLVPFWRNNVRQSFSHCLLDPRDDSLPPALWSLDSCLNQVQCVQAYLANGRWPSGRQIFPLLWPPCSISHVDQRSCITHSKPSLLLLCLASPSSHTKPTSPFHSQSFCWLTEGVSGPPSPPEPWRVCTNHTET